MKFQHFEAILIDFDQRQHAGCSTWTMVVKFLSCYFMNPNFECFVIKRNYVNEALLGDLFWKVKFKKLNFCEYYLRNWQLNLEIIFQIHFSFSHEIILWSLIRSLLFVIFEKVE